MIVNEIFTSIQGESSWQGFPFTFVRLTGCNLRCVYCDTTYAYDIGTSMEPGQIISEVEKRGVKRVLITGGEPLLQDDTPRLIELLIRKGFTVLMETNGSFSLADIDRRCVKIVDVKTPGSGEGGSFLEENLPLLDGKDEIKFVLTGRDDFTFACTFMNERFPDFPGTVLLSPAHGILDPETLVKWMVEEKPNFRLNLQLHKFIFKMSKRGV